jgi:NDP-sugar pyrophosphorylase family protein
MIPAAVIIAGGIATRLRPMTENTPKAMLPIAGKPFIAHQLSLLKRKGLQRVVICSGYLSRQIEDFVSDGSRFGLAVSFSVDGDKLLGTGGAVKKALPLLGKEFFVLYGDSYLNVDFISVYKYFHSRKAEGLMTVFKNRDAWDKSNIVFKDGKVAVYDKKNKTKDMEYIDYGLSLLESSVFRFMDKQEVFDLADFYKEMVSRGLMIGYEVSERFYEIGSPEGFAETEAYLLNNTKAELKNG